MYLYVDKHAINMKRFILSFLCLWVGFFTELNAQNRLYPSRCPDDIPDWGYLFAFSIRPSFSTETICYYDIRDNSLVLREKEPESQYAYQKKQKQKKETKIKESRCPLQRETALHFQKLFLAATLSSSYLAERTGAKDGTSYVVIIEHYYAACWSPDNPDSNCHRIAEILKNLATAIKTKDLGAIENMLSEVDSLTSAFEGFYPEDVKMNADSIINYYCIY